MSTWTAAITIVAVLATAVLRAIDHTSWQTTLSVAVGALAVRVGVLAYGAARREVPWLRLLLPAILLLEGVGLWWRGSSVLWQVRLGLAVALEIAFVVVAVRELRRTATGTEPVEARIAQAFSALVPLRAARLVAFELVVVGSALRFLLGGWRRPVPAGFTYHRESGLRLLLPILPLLAIGDVLLLDLVILPGAAWWLRIVVHGLAIYGVIWLVGLYASLRARPHVLANDRLALHRGILRRLEVPLAEIVSVDKLPSFADDWKQRAYCKGAIRLDVAGGTILELRLQTPARPIGVLGDGTASTRVLLAVDDPESFIAAIRAGHNSDELIPSLGRRRRASSAQLARTTCD